MNRGTYGVTNFLELCSKVQNVSYHLHFISRKIALVHRFHVSSFSLFELVNKTFTGIQIGVVVKIKLEQEI